MDHCDKKGILVCVIYLENIVTCKERFGKSLFLAR